MSNLFALNLAGMCGNCFFGLRGQFKQISRIKTEISPVSIFFHGNNNLQMLAPISQCMKGYYLFLSIIRYRDRCSRGERLSSSCSVLALLL
jgi:hypothetical protein